MCLLLVSRPAPLRTSARPAHKHAQSMRSGDGPRRRGGCRRRVRATGAAPPRDWPGEARPCSRAARRGVERAPTRGEEQPWARAGCLRRVSVPGAASVASWAALAPCDALKCFFGDQWGVCGAAAASHALRNVAGWRQATCTGQIRSLCGVHGA